MPWPMVHFAVAQQLSMTDPSPHILIGSIAPDAIHVRGQITREEKGSTHLVRNGLLPSAEMIKGNYAAYLNKKPEAAWKEFIFGYFAHIYTDLRWVESLYTDFKKEYKGEVYDIRTMYNLEVSQLEYELKRSESWTDSVLKKLKHSVGYTIDPFVEQSEVEQYRTLKLEWLLDERNEPKVELTYFTLDKVRKFIQDTSSELRALLIESGNHIHGG